MRPGRPSRDSALADRTAGNPPVRGAAAIRSRKQEHLLYALHGVEARRPPGWGDVELVHSALPELDFEEVDLTTTFLGHRLAAPLVIAAMTGGHEDAKVINERLGRAAQRYGIAIAIGSQRAALRDPSLRETYAVAREQAPNGFLIGNLGAAQLVAQDAGEPALDVDDVREAVEMLSADAMAIHLNFLEEVVQPEGDRRARGCLAALERVARALEVPVIAKETGAGISAAVAERVAAAGVAALDVGGRGGTSFAAIEAERAAARGDARRARLGEAFRDWGLPTAVSVVAAASAGLPIVATGGVRSGLDAAKALALGADLVGVARPMLEAALVGDEAVNGVVEQLLLELRTAMFLTESPTVGALRAVPRVVLGETRAWLQALGLAA